MRRWQIVLIGLVVALLTVGVALAQREPPRFVPLEARLLLTPTPMATDSVHPPERARQGATMVARALASTADCDSAALRIWLLTQQNAIQQTVSLFGHSGRRETVDLVNSVLSQLSVIETEPRPACADTAMIWTYYLYTTWIESAACRGQTDSACSDNVSTRVQTYVEQTSALYDSLLRKSGLSAFDLTEISANDFLVESALTPSPVPTRTPTATATTPRKTSPRAQTPEAPTPESGRGAQSRAIRSAIDSSLMVGRVNGVQVIDADSIAELRGHFSGRGVIVAFSVSALQQAAYQTDSILLMETVAAAISSNRFDLQFLIIVAYDPESTAFTKASLVLVNDVLDYQAGRITRDQLLKSIENIDNNTLPQV